MSDVSIEMTHPQRDMSLKHVNIIVDHHMQSSSSRDPIFYITLHSIYRGTGCSKSEYK